MKANATKAVHIKKEPVWLSVNKEVLVYRIKIHYTFWLQHKTIFIATKLQRTSKSYILMQEKANPTDNANAYLRGLTNYCAKRCCFDAKLPY